MSLLTVLTSTLVLLTWQKVSDFMPSPVCPFSLSSLPLWSYLLDRKWVTLSRFNCVPSHCPYSHSGPIGLTESEWFHNRFSCVSSHLPHSHSGPVGLTVCEWFHARSSCVSPHCSYSHFFSADLTESEWFHARYSCVPSHCPPFHSGSVLDRKWVIPYWIQLGPFSPSSLLPIWTCCLDRKWVIPW